jgi:hypothetical protein
MLRSEGKEEKKTPSILHAFLIIMEKRNTFVKGGV